jgi:hypothetical protein
MHVDALGRRLSATTASHDLTTPARCIRSRHLTPSVISQMSRQDSRPNCHSRTAAPSRDCIERVSEAVRSRPALAADRNGRRNTRSWRFGTHPAPVVPPVAACDLVHIRVGRTDVPSMVMVGRTDPLCGSAS